MAEKAIENPEIDLFKADIWMLGIAILRLLIENPEEKNLFNIF